MWVSAKVASHMFNVSERRLVSLQGAGEIVGYLDKAVARGRSRGEWVYLVTSIHEWRLREAGHVDISDAVADAARRLGL